MKEKQKLNSDEDRLILARKKNLDQLKNLGVNPYPINFDRNALSKDAVKELEKIEKSKKDKVKTKSIKIAGRIMAIRGQGKMVFMDLQDSSGRIQTSFRSDILADKFNLVKFLDIGDILGLNGPVFRTKRGEPTVEVQDLTILSKSLRPLPDKWAGLKDIEKRYRQRYLDLIANPDSFDIATKRSQIVSFIRRFMDERGYLEVETPILVSIPAGANARPFSTKHNSLNRNLYLRIATELNLKKLIVGGIDKVYELGRVFRNEGIDYNHNPEFTTIESYEAYSEYNTIMKLVEELVHGACRFINHSSKIDYDEDIGTIDFTPPWERLELRSAIKEFSGIDFMDLKDNNNLGKKMAEVGIIFESNSSWATKIDKIISDKVEPNLIQPTFLIDYPVEMSPLAKRKKEGSKIVERFEAFVLGSELANAFTELNDPIDQRQRFEEQESMSKEFNDEELDRLEEDFLVAIEHGMPPTGGLGLGIDRLVMLLTKSKTIRDVVLFPQLKSIG